MPRRKSPGTGHNSDPELGEIFDLNRTKLTAQLVAQIEQCLKDIESAQDDLKTIVASAKEQGFSPRDLAAMRRIAKIRLKDKMVDARAELEALQRIGDACGVDLFNWQQQDDADQAET